jgi:NAD(P)-dependent dehydrogenase (short-subunit alcohol dehydrogenase family)
MKLENKIGLVTGGASGIGRATCILASKEGASVIVTDIDDANGKQTAELVKQSGGRASYYHMDVTKEDEVRRVVSGVVHEHGRIDFLHNNAGGWKVDMSDTPKSSVQLWSQLIDLNLTSVFIVTRYVIENMCERKSGAIVNASSINGFYPNPGCVAYSTAKAGVIGFTKTMALELAPYNIRINAVCPGEIRTPIWNNTFKLLPNSEKAVESLRRAIPLHRIGEPEDIARSVVWLASDEASYITGAILVVDGGRTVGVPVEE